MPTYRVYYAEREATDADKSPFYSTRLAQFGLRESEPYKETEWEEELEAPSASGALDAFFREHVRDNSELRWVDEGGESRPVEGLHYDSDKAYVWIEDGKMMEYQGLAEATPGMVTCPLCEGSGEVDEEIAKEFMAEWGEEEEQDQLGGGA